MRDPTTPESRAPTPRHGEWVDEAGSARTHEAVARVVERLDEERVHVGGDPLVDGHRLRRPRGLLGGGSGWRRRRRGCGWGGAHRAAAVGAGLGYAGGRRGEGGKKRPWTDDDSPFPSPRPDPEAAGCCCGCACAEEAKRCPSAREEERGGSKRQHGSRFFNAASRAARGSAGRMRRRDWARFGSAHQRWMESAGGRGGRDPKRSCEIRRPRVATEKKCGGF